MATTIYGGQPTDLVNDPIIGPAQKLYQNKFSPPSLLTYPMDLSQEHRKHSIIFKIYEIVPFFENIGGERVTNTPDLGAYNEMGSLDAVVEKATSLTSKMKDEYTRGGFTNFNSKTRSNPVATIALYMPDTINFTTNAQYDNLSVAKAAENTSLPLVGRIAKAITSTVGGEGLSRLLTSRLGYVLNPQQQLLFEGIDFRTFDFSFTFTPRSQKEANSIKNIITELRKHSLPEINKGAAGFFFTPPSIFEIEFKSGDSINSNIPKIKRCVVETVDVNFAPNGWAAHVDGAPVQTTMQMRVKEIELVDSNEVKSGY